MIICKCKHSYFERRDDETIFCEFNYWLWKYWKMDVLYIHNVQELNVLLSLLLAVKEK